MTDDYNTMTEQEAREIAATIRDVLGEIDNGIMPGTYAENFTRDSPEIRSAVERFSIDDILASEADLAENLARIPIDETNSYQQISHIGHQVVDAAVGHLLSIPYQWKAQGEAYKPLPEIIERITASLPREYLGGPEVAGIVNRASHELALGAETRRYQPTFQADVLYVAEPIKAELDQRIRELLAPEEEGDYQITEDDSGYTAQD